MPLRTTKIAGPGLGMTIKGLVRVEQTFDDFGMYCGLPDGKYNKLQVHLDRSPCAMLMPYAPKHDPSWEAVLVKDGFVTGVVRLFDPRHPEAKLSESTVDPGTLPAPDGGASESAPAVADASPSEPSESLGSFTVATLKSMCQDRGLSPHGNKADLIARLKSAEA